MNSEPSYLYPLSPKPHGLYDVIVAGGGPAGIGAALAAAINGTHTLILEARSQFGGTATATMWMEINSGSDGPATHLENPLPARCAVCA